MESCVFFKREAALWIPVFFFCFFLFVTVIVAKLKLKSANLKKVTSRSTILIKVDR